MGEFFLQTLLILHFKKMHTPFWVVFSVGGRKCYLLTMPIK